MLRSAAVVVALFVLGAFVPAAEAQSPVSAKRDTEPVVLKGSALGGWSVPANQTVKLPFMDLAGTEACQAHIGVPNPDDLKPGSYDPTDGGVGIPDPTGPTAGAVTYDPDSCPPQDYAKPEVDTAATQDGIASGTPTDRILGYRYDTGSGHFRQIPLQVDEVFTRYLDNSRSGFAIYSGQDQHTTYAFDREPFRYTDNAPDDPCQSIPRKVGPDGVRLKALPDPVPGLDNNDEIAFMYSDAGPRAPTSIHLPSGIVDARVVTLADPFADGKRRFVYLMRSAKNGPKPAFTARNGYVKYKRDANADRFALSASSYADYGNAPKGPYCDPQTGKVVIDPKTGQPAIGQRRPLDTATVSTSRYRFRYDGRWLLTKIQIAGDHGYGPDLVDRWKARAFAQDPASETPCCGYEEEDSNWGGSSITLGERVGPVRAIRETWGADSGTNVIRRETFYRRETRQKTWLRVHVIPPLDGIYSQWDFNAGRVTRFYNPRNSDNGFAIDGRNDEVFGNVDDPCNDLYDDAEHDGDRDFLTKTYRQAYQGLAFGGHSFCSDFPYHQSIDLPDPTVSDANASLSWSEVAGVSGTIVDRTSTTIEDLTPGGAAQSLVAVPYYRDDACFDDGTGSDPGVELHPRHADQEKASGAGGARHCWRGKPAVPGGDPQFWQGSIATHGIHILFLADSDNARLTVPTSEIVAETRMVMLPGERDGSVGEQYGRGFEKQLTAVATPFLGLSAPALPGAELPGADLPGVSVPEVPAVGVPGAPDVTVPGAPDVTVPGTPGVNAPGLTAPGLTAPSVGLPGGNDGEDDPADDTPTETTPADDAPAQDTPAQTPGQTPASSPGGGDSTPAPAHQHHKKKHPCAKKKGKAKRRCLKRHRG